MDYFYEANRFLLSLGFLPKVKGFGYLREAVCIMAADRTATNLKSDVFPKLAKKYNTNVANVEKSMTNAIDRVWLKTDIEYLYAEVRIVVNEKRGKPTCKEFLSHAAYVVRERSRVESYVSAQGGCF